MVVVAFVAAAAAAAVAVDVDVAVAVAVAVAAGARGSLAQPVRAHARVCARSGGARAGCGTGVSRTCGRARA